MLNKKWITGSFRFSFSRRYLVVRVSAQRSITIFRTESGLIIPRIIRVQRYKIFLRFASFFSKKVRVFCVFFFDRRMHGRMMGGWSVSSSYDSALCASVFEPPMVRWEDDFKVISDKWKVISDKWKVISEKWKVISEKWKVKSDKWKVISEKWKVKSDKWKVKSEKWKTTG